MTRSIYLHLSNDQDMGLHPNNVDVDFSVDLRTPLQLNGLWEVSLVAYKGPRRNEDHFVCCDTIQVSPVGSGEYPVLRSILEKKTAGSVTLKSTTNEASYDFIQPRYVAVNRQRIERIRVFLTKPNGTQLEPLKGGMTQCVLHWRRIL